MSNLVGNIIGRYKILELLGKGGMAYVYKALDTRLERLVAVKIITFNDPENSALFIKRFEREAKALAKLSHPNIVKIHDYGETDGVPYLVMEYLKGGSLKDKVKTAIPYREAAHYLLPIAQALGYAHGQNIIHRDVKPGNILFHGDDTPMLTDLGSPRCYRRNQ